MATASVVAAALRYPSDGHRQWLEDAVPLMDEGEARRHMGRFVKALRRYSETSWEELHTDTLDLSPHFVPYVGHAIWGESYDRGRFMAELIELQAAEQIDPNGELPDHLEPILRYLEAADQPMSELVEVLPKAMAKMREELATADRKNPYLHVLDAARAVVHEMGGQPA